MRISQFICDGEGCWWCSGIEGGMFVFRDALVEAAKTAGMLVDLTSDPFLLWMRMVLRRWPWQRRLTVLINIMGRLGRMVLLRRAFVI